MHSTPSVIQPISKLLDLLTTPIHPTWFPIAPVPILHATRISVIYRSLRKQSGGQVSWLANLVGFLMMAWGGSIGSHILLSLPIPQLLSFTPLLVYTTIHTLLPNIDKLPSMKTLDSILPLIDALLRTTAITSGVEACRSHPLPAISESLSAQLIIGAICSSGGGIAAQTLSVWEPHWRLNRPVFLQGTMLASTDVWSGTLTAAIYGFLTASHPTYNFILISFLPNNFLIKLPLLSPLDSKAIAAFILTLIYCWRSYNLHYLKSKTLKLFNKSLNKNEIKNSKSKKE